MEEVAQLDLNEEQLQNKICPKCGAPLIVRSTKNGHILGCSNYPICDYLENIKVHGVKVLKILEEAKCPICGESLAVKKSKYGLFIGCQDYPNCKYIYTEPEKNSVVCPSCQNGVLRQHANKYGKAFYSCSNFKNCKYTLNYKPIAHECSKCKSSILVVRVNKLGKYLQCPNKDCRAKYPYSEN